jgi:hypothetical protein
MSGAQSLAAPHITVHAAVEDGCAVCAASLDARCVNIEVWPAIGPESRCVICQAMLDFVDR